nr:zinc finger BED domain-containing protein RICESLEEPER 3-like isoform X2 [Ipomoea batatas]
MRPIKKKFRLQPGRSATSRSSLTPSIHSVSASSTDSDSIVKGKVTRAKARANDANTTGGTTTSSGVEKNKPKAKRPRSEIWDHFHKFINDSGDHKAHLKELAGDEDSLKPHFNVKSSPTFLNQMNLGSPRFEKKAIRASTAMFHQPRIPDTVEKMVVTTNYSQDLKPERERERSRGGAKA